MGRLTGVKFHHSDSNKNSYWLFKCTCGKSKVIRASSVKHGAIQSCGCFIRELLQSSKGSRANAYKHGLSDSIFYKKYVEMKVRCYNPENHRYRDYGGRGIKVNQDWHDFKVFKVDMYDSFLGHVERFGIKNTQIDRVDNNGNYSLDNCRWATYKEQARNTRRNRIIEFTGAQRCLSEWAEVYNIRVSTLHARLKRGWSVREALTVKVLNH